MASLHGFLDFRPIYMVFHIDLIVVRFEADRPVAIDPGDAQIPLPCRGDIVQEGQLIMGRLQRF